MRGGEEGCPGCGSVGPCFRELPAADCILVFLLLAFEIEKVLECRVAFV